MKIREVKKFVKNELGSCPLQAKWRKHTGMLEMYVREDRHHDWHEVISIQIEHVRSRRYSDNLLKSNLKRSIEALKRKNGHHKATKAHKK